MLPLMRPYLPVLLIGGVLALVVAGMEGAIAWLVKPALDDIFIRRDQAMLRLIPVLLLAAYLAKGAARYGQSYLMAASASSPRCVAPSIRTSRACRCRSSPICTRPS
jgi:subfamily B ATP-binding cassette protein MsbA